MREVFVLEVTDPSIRPDGTRYVRRFTFTDRSEAWAKYQEALRFGFEASMEDAVQYGARASAPVSA